MKITFYFAPGCWVCAAIEETLNGLKDRYRLDITRTDITENEETYELYRFDVPVIEFEDGTTLYQRIRRKDLLEKLDALTHTPLPH